MKYLVESNNKIIAINDNGVVCDFTYKDKDLFGRKGSDNEFYDVVPILKKEWITVKTDEDIKILARSEQTRVMKMRLGGIPINENILTEIDGRFVYSGYASSLDINDLLKGYEFNCVIINKMTSDICKCKMFFDVISDGYSVFIVVSNNIDLIVKYKLNCKLNCIIDINLSGIEFKNNKWYYYLNLKNGDTIYIDLLDLMRV